MNRSIPFFLSALQIWNPTMPHSSSSSIDTFYTFCIASGGVMAIHERRASAVGEFGLVGSESWWFSSWIFHPLSPKSCGDFAILPDREMPFQRLRFECQRLTCQAVPWKTLMMMRWSLSWRSRRRDEINEHFLKQMKNVCPQLSTGSFMAIFGSRCFHDFRHHLCHLREHHPRKNAKALKSHGFNCSCSLGGFTKTCYFHLSGMIKDLQ